MRYTNAPRPRSLYLTNFPPLKNTPTPPPAPDYGAANREGVQAQIDALPLQNAINAASTLGSSYTDPNTGKTYDFSGLGSQDIAHQQLMQQLADSPAAAQALLSIQQQYGPGFAQAARDSLHVTDPTGFALRDQFGGQLASGAKSNESLASGVIAPTFEQIQGNGPINQQLSASDAPSFATMGSADAMQKLAMPAPAADYGAYIRNNPDLLANWESNESKIPGKTIEQYGQEHYTANGQGEGRGLPMTAGSLMQQFNGLADLQGVGNTHLADTGASAAGRSALEQQIFDRLAQSGQSDPSLQRAAEQAARARGASSGNLYGSGSALNEALAVQQQQTASDQQRRSDALQLLSSGQTSSDTNNRLQQAQQQSDLAAAGLNNAAAQQGYANRFQNAGFNNAATQQNFDNTANVTQANNAAAQQNFQNAGTRATFNNATAQQGFQNRGAIVDQNNTAANQSFQNAMAAIGQRNQSMQNMFADQQSLSQQRMGARQQDIANTQSYLGLTPIVSQGAQLSGLQQGAAPTVSGTGYSAMGAQANAGQLGSAFAGNVFGTQASIYGKQLENQSSPLGALAGSFLGAATGGAGAGLGKKLGGFFG